MRTRLPALLPAVLLGCGLFGGGSAKDDAADDTGGGSDTGGDNGGGSDTGGDNGGGDTPSMRWRVFEGTCGRGDLTFEDVPSGAFAILFTHGTDDRWALNPPMGMSTVLDEATGVLTVPCGTGNDIPEGSAVRVALGYPAAELSDGDDVGFDVYAGTCGSRPMTLADGVYVFVDRVR